MKPNSIWKVLTPVLVLISFIVIFLTLVKSQYSRRPNIEGTVEVSEGSILPDFEVTSLEGTKTQISKIPAKLMMLNFWATWCAACLEEMPSINALRAAYKDQGFEVLGINLDENPEAAVPRVIQGLKIEFPIFKDDEGALGELFDVHAIPLTVIIDQQRKILYTKDGELDWNSPSVRSQIEKWLKG